METTQDQLLGGRLTLLQPKKGYRVAVDPVLLAASIPAYEGQRALDLGAGTGAASFCLEARAPGCRITGIENNPAYLDLARQSVSLNGWQEYIHFMEGNVAAPPEELPENYFEWVFANPPYFDAGSYSPSPQAGKSSAHAMRDGLEPWVECAARHVKNDGWFFMIYPAEDDEALVAINKSFREIRVLRIQPKMSEGSNRLILAARKSGIPAIKEAGTLILHEDSGEYTEAARAILWDATALTMI